jgi:hypothetical protein
VGHFWYTLLAKKCFYLNKLIFKISATSSNCGNVLTFYFFIKQTKKKFVVWLKKPKELLKQKIKGKKKEQTCIQRIIKNFYF